MKKIKVLSLGIIAYIVFLSLGCGSSGGGNNHTPDMEQANAKPLAVIKGNINAKPGQLIELSGSDSSDPDGDLLTYKWSLIFSPTGAKTTLSSINTPDTSITPDIDGLYRIQLIVNNGKVDSNPSTIEIIASTPNSAPTANAGTDQNVSTGSLVTIDGSTSSDADGDPLTYNWSFISVPTGSSAVLSDPTAIYPNFTAEIDGSYVLSLVVNDGPVNSTSDTVTIIAVKPLRKLPDTGQIGDYATPFGEDSDYSINPMSYTDNGDGTVTDNVTGLMWQKQFDIIMRKWAEALSQCEGLTLAGYTDWRLPAKKELMGIVNYRTILPAINETFFNTTSWDYWTTTTSAGYPSLAWHVDFGTGRVERSDKLDELYVRCARGEPQPTPNLIDNGNGTITDNVTGLIWQQSEEDFKDWESAITYCQELSLSGYSDWRLPNIKELESMVSDTKYIPALDINYFPYARTSDYWSSTTDLFYSLNAWRVDFGSGTVGILPKTFMFDVYVRCVRGE